MFLLHAFLLHHHESILPSFAHCIQHPRGIIHTLWETSNPKGELTFFFPCTYFHRSCSLSFSPVPCGENDIYYTCQHFVSPTLILSSQAFPAEQISPFPHVVLLILTLYAFSSSKSFFLSGFIRLPATVTFSPHLLHHYFLSLLNRLCSFTLLSCAAAWFTGWADFNLGLYFHTHYTLRFLWLDDSRAGWLFTKAVPASICKYRHSCSSRYLSPSVLLVNTREWNCESHEQRHQTSPRPAHGDSGETL